MRRANTVVIENFDKFADARKFALRLSGVKRLTRTENRHCDPWRLNDTPACYAALHPNGESWCDVVPRGCGGWSCIYEIMSGGRVVTGGKNRRK